MNIPENILSSLTDEQKKRVETAKTPEELLALAKESGYELTPVQMESIAGGGLWIKCPGHDQHTCPDRCPVV